MTICGNVTGGLCVYGWGDGFYYIWFVALILSAIILIAAALLSKKKYKKSAYNNIKSKTYLNK